MIPRTKARTITCNRRGCLNGSSTQVRDDQSFQLFLINYHHAVHQFGLFQFKVGPNSRPTTPTAIAMSRVANFGLDALSGLFSPSKSGRDVLGEIGASLAHKRTRSAGPPISSMSRSSISMTDMTISTNRFSQRSASTAATSISTMDDVESIGSGSGGSGRSRKGLARKFSEASKRKLVKSSARAQSPGTAVLSDPEMDRATRSKSPNSIEETEEEEFRTIMGNRNSWHIDNSDRDLAMRLELARQNSLTQEAKRKLEGVFSVETPVEETIYEGEGERSFFKLGSSLTVRSCRRTPRDRGRGH
jgi:protein ECT2